MDQNLLVSSGHSLVRALDDDGFKPRLAMWVHGADPDAWKLWLTPPDGYEDKLEFYRRVSSVINKNREKMGGLYASDTKLALDSHPAVRGIGNFIRIDGLGSFSFPGNRFDGYYLPDGIILRSALS